MLTQLTALTHQAEYGNEHELILSDGTKVFVDKKMPSPLLLIPSINGKKMLAVAESFESIFSYDLSMNAYLDYIYTCLAPSEMSFSFHNPKVRGWFTPDTGRIWRRVANAAFFAGERINAYEYLAKSVIFGKEDGEKEARLLIETWNMSSELPEVSLDSKKQMLDTILSMYIEMNIHPRCMDVINAHRESFEEESTIITDIQKRWVSLTEKLKVHKKVVLYGQEIWPNGDPLSVTIPWPCSEEAIAKVQEILKRELGTDLYENTSDSDVESID